MANANLYATSVLRRIIMPAMIVFMAGALYLFVDSHADRQHEVIRSEVQGMCESIAAGRTNALLLQNSDAIVTQGVLEALEPALRAVDARPAADVLSIHVEAFTSSRTLATHAATIRVDAKTVITLQLAEGGKGRMIVGYSLGES